MYISRLRLQLAVQALQAGELVVYPTEGVWGIGCDPFDPKAVHALLTLKQRPVEKSLILVASSVEQFEPFLNGLSKSQLETLTNSWPGPHTWLLPVNQSVPPWISGGKTTVALRVSAHPLVSALCNAYGGPIVSTSANCTGQASALSILDLRCHLLSHRHLMQARCPLPITLVPGDLQQPGRCSQIRDLASGQVLRS